MQAVLSVLLSVVAPVFAVALVGYVYAGRKRLDLAGITDLILYVSAPALIFSSLVKHELEAEQILRVGGGAIFICLSAFAGIYLLLRIRGQGAPGLHLAAMIPNTGNLGLPLAFFAFHDEGLALAVVVFVAVTLLHYSAGIMVLTGSIHPGPMLRMPLFHAAVLGLACALLDLHPPGAFLGFLEILGDATIPLMLLSLGARMRSVRLSSPMRPALVATLRILPAFLAAWAWTWFFGLEGPARGVVLVTGVLPSAVMNFALAEKYKQQGDEVAAVILLGTLLSVLAIPLVLSFAGVSG